ncbi:exocyst complex component 4 [Ditylenchus destructor]|uniref:Exocyst complex component Sec8 n=1 Tax=Ditylenchus destructor TaxID=166010 RepID=A0AAD4R953_9BILA|nr:exocyst complex component 4 [Ditylenchus destructor]
MLLYSRTTLTPEQPKLTADGGGHTDTDEGILMAIIRTRSHQGDNLIEYPKISAAWAVDEDISRLLKSLPNWAVISQWSPMVYNAGEATPGAALHLNESEQDVRQRTQRESDILIGNLGTQKQIQRVELITDMEHVKSLVCMHESLQWFASNMRTMINALPPKAKELMKCRIQIKTTNMDGSEQVVEQLLSEALEDRLSTLEAMSETCLLMLHLEIRVHCFYHLLPLIRSRNSLAQEEQDREVVEFGKDIGQFHHTLAMYMVPNKLKYLFDGLGHLCASIFIHSSQYINKLMENDRKRMCRNIYTVQKCLSQLSGRPETEMNRAQTFFKLVNLDTFDQIFALVKESGETYTHLEYTYLLSLAVRSHPTLSSQPGALESMLSQLRDSLAR